MTTNANGKRLLRRLLAEFEDAGGLTTYDERDIAEARDAIASIGRIAELEARVATLEAEAEEARINSLDDNDREGCE
jgi:hypothetical protein